MRIISGSARGTRLETLEGNFTRPTLDRVKEALFSKLQNDIPEARVLDLFAGSGALGLEALSRGAKEAIFCDKSYEANMIIRKNIEKTKMQEKSKVIKEDYQDAIKKLAKEEPFDLIFLDPPYEKDIATNAVELILSNSLIAKNGIILLETDKKERELERLNNLQVNVYDSRKYGRVTLLFLNRKG